MKSQIAYCNGKWAIPVLVNDDGSIFFVIPNTNIKMPFVTDEKYTLMDGHDLQSVTTKLIMAEMKIKVLNKQVADNYSSKYLEKYFNEKIVDLPNLDVVNKIVTKYCEFLDITVMRNGDKWYVKWDEIKKEDISKIEKDIKYINLFNEFLNTNN